MTNPLERLGRWLDDAREAGVPAAGAMTLVTASADGAPSARVVALKRLEADGLVFTTALWTRKVEELRLASLLFVWADSRSSIGPSEPQGRSLLRPVNRMDWLGRTWRVVRAVKSCPEPLDGA